MTQVTPTSTPLLHGRYRIETKLGTGRLATIYRAYDERLQRPVLIHMLRKDLVGQEALRQRFIQESHTSARRSHQSLLEVFDSGEVGDRPYMVTEFVEGPTLRELGALALEDALLYFRQVVGAVAACQAAGVPHPPISSNNLILIADGHVELFENWQTPAADLPIDIASYRAPERTAGEPATPASSVYSLGLLLFEMLTGQRPITGDDPRTIAQAHLTAHLPALSQIRPAIYLPALDRLIQRATAREPSQRPRDAAALGQEFDALRREQSGETRRLSQPPVQPPSMRERINRSTGGFIGVAPLRPAPVPPPDPVAPSVGPATDHGRGQVRQDPRRSLGGLAIMLVMIVVVACGSYYLVNRIVDRLFNASLPVPEFELPFLPDLGFELPDWFTGAIRTDNSFVVFGAPDGLNLRNAPGSNTQILAVLPNGTRVLKLAGPQVVDDIPWIQVRVRLEGNDLEGWLSERFVKPETR